MANPGPDDEHVLTAFQVQVSSQCEFGLLAVELLNAALTAPKGTPQELVQRQVWFAIQAFLVAAANVSKLLWGSKRSDPEMQQKQDEQRARLRASLGVPDDSPLRSRKFRNLLEHFDREIEHWAETTRNRNLLDGHIGPPGSVSGLNWRDHFRTFDPATATLTIRRMKLELQPIATALEQLAPVATQAWMGDQDPPPSSDEPSNSGGGG